MYFACNSKIIMKHFYRITITFSDQYIFIDALALIITIKNF